MDFLETISPIDGRYHRYTAHLSPFFSEQALMQYRLQVECHYLLSLSDHPQINVRTFTPKERTLLNSLTTLSLDDAKIIKSIETKGYNSIKATNHDVKAIEYFMKEKLKHTSLEDSLEWIHFALTSEDINNISYALMLRDSLEQVILPKINEVKNTINHFAQQYKDLPMLARTHGQPASPTTFGKEFKVFSNRLEHQLQSFTNTTIFAKLNGATGNYNAHYAAYPQIDWPQFTINFIESFNTNQKMTLSPNLCTTQIEPHDTYAQLFDNLHRINTILIDFNQDIWRYISDDWITQKPVAGEVGSSTMPHKVNPIDFENSEGNLGLANALLTYFSTKLPLSRLQRDLSDSTVERNFGIAFAHSLIGYQSTLKGLGKMSINETKIKEELQQHPQIISEAIQTILRRENIPLPYEQLKDLTRGKTVTLEDFHQFITSLNISEPLRQELLHITPLNYIGMASQLAK